jgi:lipopolysaccharide/colanic/teichoic acid biosynthesis glycosyltransferase
VTRRGWELIIGRIGLRGLAGLSPVATTEGTMITGEEVGAASGEGCATDIGSSCLMRESLALVRDHADEGPADGASGPRQRARDLTASSGFYARYTKPVFDRTIGLLLLVVFAPVLAAVAAAIRRKLGSPIIYVQPRVGRNGEPLNFIKFRTMLPDRRAHTAGFDGPDQRKTHKTDADPRHTRFGRFLRKTTLDELPQLVHVVRGEMSLVGPRPELRSVVENKYEPWQDQRHVVKPGLTGLWQVSGRNSLPYERWMELDLMYVDHWSLRLDVEIIARTIPTILARKGAL